MNHLKSCGNMLRFRKTLVRRGKLAGLEVRISRYTIHLLESQLLLVIKLWLPF
jgi:hypothetical protein